MGRQEPSLNSLVFSVCSWMHQWGQPGGRFIDQQTTKTQSLRGLNALPLSYTYPLSVHPSTPNAWRRMTWHRRGPSREKNTTAPKKRHDKQSHKRKERHLESILVFWRSMCNSLPWWVQGLLWKQCHAHYWGPGPWLDN